MRQGYFIVVLAHSIHGRLRRIHIPHQVVYVVLALAVFGTVSLFGVVSSYLRMTWKVANYNSLRNDMDVLRSRYQTLQKEAKQKDENLASLQVLASEVQVALGVKRSLEGPSDIAFEGPLLPTYKESLEQYNFLRSASFSRLHNGFLNQFSLNAKPALWPVMGRITSSFGMRMDPLSGEPGVYHPGLDISAVVGQPVAVTGDGVVVKTEWLPGYGRTIMVEHGGRIQTLYAHLSKWNVVVGQAVRMGETVGYAGGTGRVTGPHLHYEVRLGGTPVNPGRYLTATSATLASNRVRSTLPF